VNDVIDFLISFFLILNGAYEGVVKMCFKRDVICGLDGRRGIPPLRI